MIVLTVALLSGASILGVVFILGVVTILAVALTSIRRSANRRAKDASRHGEQTREALERAEQRCSEGQQRIDELTRQLATAVAPLPVPVSVPPAAHDGEVRSRAVLVALWGFSALRRARSRRDTEAVSTAAAVVGPLDGLEGALVDEVSRLREEAGTPGAVSVALESEPDAGAALVMLGGVEALLGTLSRHCQAYELHLHEDDGRLLAVLVCDGFDGPDSVADDTSDILAVLQPLDGRLEVDRDDRGRLRARLSIPTAAEPPRSGL